MALSGTISSEYGSNGIYKAELRWNATQNITNNTSTIRLQFYFVKIASDPYGSFNNNNTSKVTLNIAGSTYTKTANFDLRDEAVGTELLLATYSKTIKHNNDGTKSVGISGTHATNIGLGTKTVSGTASLNTIPRASSVSANNMTMGTASTITVAKKNSDFTHRLYYTFGSKKDVAITSGAVSSTSVSFTPPLSLASEIPSATSATMTIRCVTYNGSTQVGTATKSVKLSVPSSVKPSVSSVTIAEAVSGLNAQFGAYIQGQSKVKCTVNTTTAYGSAIASYRVEINGAVYTSKTFTTDFLQKSGSNTVKVTVTDKRGRTSNAYSTTFNVLAYTKPTITTFRVARYSDLNTPNEDGAYIRIFISGTATGLSNKNTIALAYKHKLSSQTTYTEVAVSVTNYTFEYASGLLSGFSQNSSYDFETTLTDYFADAITVFNLPTAFATMDILRDGTGVAFGKVAETQDCLDIGFNKVHLGRKTLMAPYSNAEKQIRFTNTATATDAASGVYAHDVYIYGGRSGSPVSIGAYDYIAKKRIWAYQQHLGRFYSEADEFLWKGKEVDRIIESKNSGGGVSTRVWGDGYCVICGTVTVAVDTANTPKGVAITFGKTFKERPNLQVTANTSVIGTSFLGCSFTGLSTTGATIYANRTNTTETVLYWRVEGFIEV